MTGPPDKRRAPPAGNGSAPQEIIALENDDGSEDSPQTPKKQVLHPHCAGFARAAVFEEFGYKSARAIDYGAFVDRTPGRARRRWMVAP